MILTVLAAASAFPDEDGDSNQGEYEEHPKDTAHYGCCIGPGVLALREVAACRTAPR